MISIKPEASEVAFHLPIQEAKAKQESEDLQS